MPTLPLIGAFPALNARNLNGRTFALPAEFGGMRNVAIVAFQRQHQDLVDSWFPYLDTLLATHPDVCIYELPILGGVYTLARPLIDGGMASAIPNKLVRDRTLTVYTDVRRVVAALQITSTATITLLLVDRTGRIFWRDTGAYDAERAGGLERALNTLSK